MTNFCNSKFSILLAALLTSSTLVQAETNYSQFVFTGVHYNISCIDTSGNASLFSVTLSTLANGTIFTAPEDNLRYDVSWDSATPDPQEGTSVTAEGQFGEVIYSQSYTNTYTKLLKNPKTGRSVGVKLTNVETYNTASFSVSISNSVVNADSEERDPATVKGFVTRSFYTFGKASFNARGSLVRSRATSGPYFTEAGAIAYDGKTGVLK